MGCMYKSDLRTPILNSKKLTYFHPWHNLAGPPMSTPLTPARKTTLQPCTEQWTASLHKLTCVTRRKSSPISEPESDNLETVRNIVND